LLPVLSTISRRYNGTKHYIIHTYQLSYREVSVPKNGPIFAKMVLTFLAGASISSPSTSMENQSRATSALDATGGK
jgi:hypothetical protein